MLISAALLSSLPMVYTWMTPMFLRVVPTASSLGEAGIHQSMLWMVTPLSTLWWAIITTAEIITKTCASLLGSQAMQHIKQSQVLQNY